jgi:hypothetical protein
MNRLSLMPLLLALLFMVGCSSTPVLTFESSDSSRRYVQKFPRAHYSAAQGPGAYDVVLLGEGLDVGGTHRGVIKTSSGDDLHQIVHLHVLWRPNRGQKASELAASNAVIHWYVIDPNSDQPPLHYRGTGFVLVRPARDYTKFSIRGATITAQPTSGAWVDPLGRSTLKGSFTARRDDARTLGILSLVSPSSTAAATGAEGLSHGPPGRLPSQP